MPDEHGNETREEAVDRIEQVKRTQLFGDGNNGWTAEAGIPVGDGSLEDAVEAEEKQEDSKESKPEPKADKSAKADDKK